MPKLIEVFAVVLVTSLLSLLALLALDIEILQNDRDLESFRSQGFPFSPLSQGEGSLEQSAHINNQ